MKILFSLAVFATGVAAPAPGVPQALTSGDKKLHVTLGDPLVVSVATKPEKWGYFQFPSLTVSTAHEWFARWSMQPDSIASYGREGIARAVSIDRGRTWRPVSQGGDLAEGLLLPNGDRLTIFTPAAVKTSELALPPPVGAAKDSYSPSTRTFYRLEQLPAQVQGVYLKRLRQGATTWVEEHAPLEDPGALRYSHSAGDLFPVVWWGDLRVAADGAIVAAVYPGFYLRADGTADPNSAVSFCRSTDGGRSWRILSRIPYVPDLTGDVQGGKREGFTEPAFEILPNGDYLCVMRTTDGAGIGPMYACRSHDAGATWSRPEVIATNGVLPRLLRLANGVTVLASGRPGVQVRFCADCAGRSWSAPLEILPYQSAKDQVSCGYTELVADGPDRCLLIYSDFRHPTGPAETRKAIKVREITVRTE